MTLPIDTAALLILQKLQAAGYDAYLVGGAVRDLLRGVSTVTDYDITTNATPEQIMTVFPLAFYENAFGTVSLAETHLVETFGVELPSLPTQTPIDRHRIIDLAQASKVHVSLNPTSPDNQVSPQTHPVISYQITTYRADEQYDDHRRPTSMHWGNSLTEDLERRDFTINALALHFALPQLDQLLQPPLSRLTAVGQNQAELVDEHQGFSDLQNHIIRTVGDPTARFQEDALRMLRAIRFSVQLNFEIDPTTFSAIGTNAELLTHISWERIRDEVMKMLASDYPAEAIELLAETNLLSHILPELEPARGIEQSGHHTTDVWTHSLDALRACPSPDPVVRLATLLHDIAKPQTQRFQGNSITFYNHEVIGARTASKVAKRWRLSSADVERIFTLVRFHMFHYQPDMTDAAIRRFMRNVGLENIDDILDLREADRLGSGARKTSWRLEEMKQRMIEQLHQPMEIRDLAINGHDLMTEFQLQPGKILGQVLQHLFEQVLENPDLNNRETLLASAKLFLSEHQPT